MRLHLEVNERVSDRQATDIHSKHSMWCNRFAHIPLRIGGGADVRAGLQFFHRIVYKVIS